MIISFYIGFLENSKFSASSTDVMVNIEATDGVHVARSQFQIYFEDSSRSCKPKFKQQLYNLHIDVNATTFPQVIGDVEVIPCTSRSNSENIVLKIVDEDGAAGDLTISSNGSIIANRQLNSRNSGPQTVR